MKKFFKEFNEFIARGNVLDLAVAMILGAAFNAIVKSLVDHILMPLIGGIIRTNVSDLKWTLVSGTIDITSGVAKQAVVLNYGLFIQAIIDFLIIAFSVFVIIKLINKFRNKISAADALIKKKIGKQEECVTEETIEEVVLDVVENTNNTSNENIEHILLEIKEILSSFNKKSEE